jgi:hydroxymethylpyrimidine/phosphomethylpyrimidine kinase
MWMKQISVYSSNLVEPETLVGRTHATTRSKSSLCTSETGHLRVKMVLIKLYVLPRLMWRRTDQQRRVHRRTLRRAATI